MSPGTVPWSCPANISKWSSPESVGRRRVVILGLSASTFTAVHVAVSLTAIASGVLALPGTLRAGRTPALTAVFLVTSAATSVTGFFFSSAHLGKGHAIGVVSLVVLVPTALALWRHR